MAAKDVMIDIETLALSSDALVLSVGAMWFTCHDVAPCYEAEFFETPSIVEQLLLGRRVEQGTQMFWKGQSNKASEHWAGPAVVRTKVGEMLTGLAAFVAGADRVWANGICFDITILEGLYRQFNISVPWKYNAVRDARTYYDLFPETRTFSSGGPIIENVAHHPIGDCRVQINRLWERGYTTK